MGHRIQTAGRESRGQIIDSEGEAADYLKSVLDQEWERLNEGPEP